MFAQMDEEEAKGMLAGELPIERTQRSCFSGLIEELFDRSHRRGPTAVMLTSPRRKAGVSFICSNIAVELALQGESVVLIDAHALLAVRDFAPQSATVLCRRIGPSDLWVLGMEDVLGRSTSRQTLTGSDINTKLRELERAFTYVLVDAPALSVGRDANVLAPSVHGTLMVARAIQTSDADLRKACRVLRAAGGLVLGSVFNLY
jgi:succinoglycan biosynthesis transport protein ExoP